MSKTSEMRGAPCAAGAAVRASADRRHQHAVERDRAHLGNPAADQHRDRRAGEHMQAGKEAIWSKRQHQQRRQREPRETAGRRARLRERS